MLNPWVESLEPSATLALNAKAKELTSLGKTVYNYTLGEPDQRIHGSIEEAMIRAIHDGKHKYAQASGIPELKTAICDFYSKRYQAKLDPKNLIVSNGAKHSLYNTIFGKLNPLKSTIGTINPYWLSYESMAKLVGAKFKTFERKNALQNLEGLDCLILNSPSNPTGEVLGHQELDDIVGTYFTKNPKGFIISDEIYEFLSFTDFTSLGGKFLDKDIVIVNGFSKAFMMTGLRVGWAYYRNAKDAAQIDAFQSHTTSNINLVAQYGALKALSLPQTYFDDLKTVYQKRSENAVVAAKKFLPKAIITEPRGAFYLWLDVSPYKVSAKEFCDRSLKEVLVLGVPGDDFGSTKHVRFSFACNENYFMEGFSKLGEIWK